MSPPTSTSMPVATANPTLTRFRVYRTERPSFLAVEAQQPQEVRIIGGYRATVRKGDWTVADGDAILDVLSPHAFRKAYEPVTPEGLILSDAHRTRLDAALGFGSTVSADQLVAVTERLARLVIGDVKVDFTAGQWDEIAHRAEKRGITVDALIEQIVAKITQDLFTV